MSPDIFAPEARRDCMSIKQSNLIEGLRQRYSRGHFLTLGQKVFFSFQLDRDVQMKLVLSFVHRAENHTTFCS